MRIQSASRVMLIFSVEDYVSKGKLLYESDRDGNILGKLLLKKCFEKNVYIIETLKYKENVILPFRISKTYSMPIFFLLK